MKAVALFSGGLDSILAVKLVEEQGIEVAAVNFASPFFSSKNAEKSAKANSISLKVINIFPDYLRMLRAPRHGRGKGINPCIDCRIFMLKKAKQHAKKINARFMITGEVLGQRPMSQNRKALEVIDKRAGLKGKVLRPLSAKLLEETEAEKKGWVDRKKLLEIMGRGRKEQLKLARKFSVREFPSPAGGCLLCEVEFAKRLLDLFRRRKRISENDVEILKYGRHFKSGSSRIIVGRNENENRQLEKLKRKTDMVFEVKGAGSPVTILRGRKTAKAVKTAAELTARYSSAPEGRVKVSCGSRTIAVKKPLSYDEKKLLM